MTNMVATKQELLDAIHEAMKSKKVISLIPAKHQRAAIVQILQQRFKYRYSSKNGERHSFYAMTRDLHSLGKLFDLVLYQVGTTLESSIKAREFVAELEKEKDNG